ncbi:MAG: F0F1 ATP synthase subunit alpha, partial [Candidatus Poribacteria bacterium]|nr:F0F1 ATP synthase subunit alpha [Candidatus Poribacteria bacterium]
DDVEVADVARFESEFLTYMDRNHEGLLREIAETGVLSDDLIESLHDAVKSFKENFMGNA